MAPQVKQVAPEAAQAVTQAQPQNRLARVNRLGSNDTPRRSPRRSCPAGCFTAWRRNRLSCPRFLCAIGLRYYGRVARVVSPPTTLSPTFTSIVAVRGKNRSMRDPNFITPNRCPVVT